MNIFSEKSTVEKYIVNRLQELGWKYIKCQELNRESYEEPLLKKTIISSIKRINDVRLKSEDIKKILNKLEFESSGIEGIKKILRYLKEGISIKPEDKKELERIKLLDDNPDKNEYIISNQVTFKTYSERIIPDIVLFVNGIPLVVIECKNPTDPTVSWETGYNQIKDYENKFPELFKYVQFSIAAEETARYFPNLTGCEDIPVYEWKKESFDVLEATLEMLERDILIDLIKNFTFIREQRGKSSKIMPRYLQYRAANKIFNRVINNIKGDIDKNSGLIWHWQGSGKTLTMIFAMTKLYQHHLLENPTIFFILDRSQLEEQIRRVMSDLEISVDMERIESISNLEEILLYDEGRGKRGVFVTLIQKFRKDEFKELEKKLNELRYSGRKTILDRKNVIAFIDEGHRSQYGVLASEMRRLLSNAFFFAFTGTPIAKEGRDTFEVFSYPDEDYLDRYFIQESIEDGFTVPIRYLARLSDKAHLDKERLNAFLEQQLEEIPELIRDEVEERTKEKLNSLNVYLKNPERIDDVTKNVAEHFLQNLDGKFKGLLVVPDRDACLMYKKALDKYLPEEYSEVVMSYGDNEQKKYLSYLSKVKDRYNVKDWVEAKDRITTNYVEDEYPKILIVTEMLLTGFDAPILQTMYLDKPLKEHRLLQAIARTNRPYDDLKEAGLILDYIGLFDEFEKTIAIYSKGDIEGAAYEIEMVKEEFIELLQKTKELFNSIEMKTDRETLMRSIRKLIDENKGKKFQSYYQRLRKKFELLGPDPFKVEYLEDFRWLSDIYYAYTRHVKRIDPEQAEKYVNKYFKKTLDYIHQNIDIGEIRKNFPIISFDEDYLNKLEDAYQDLEGRISDISTTFTKHIKPERYKNPIYETIADRVESILERWNERKNLLEGKERKEFDSAIYQNLKDAISEVKKMRKRQIELRLNNQEYYILLILEKHLEDYSKDKLIEIAQKISEKVSEEIFENWTLQKSAIDKIGRIVRRFVRRLGVTREKRDSIYDEIMEILKASE